MQMAGHILSAIDAVRNSVRSLKPWALQRVASFAALLESSVMMLLRAIGARLFGRRRAGRSGQEDAPRCAGRSSQRSFGQSCEVQRACSWRKRGTPAPCGSQALNGLYQSHRRASVPTRCPWERFALRSLRSGRLGVTSAGPCVGRWRRGRFAGRARRCCRSAWSRASQVLPSADAGRSCR